MSVAVSIADKLTNPKLLIKNIGLNFLIHGLTILIGIITVPIIIKGVGVDRFGILTIIWSVIGYSSLLDLGLGRALTQVVSRKLGAGEAHDVALTVWTSLILISVLGVLAAVLLLSLSPWIVHLLKVPAIYYDETLQSMYLLSFSLPFLIGIFGLKGVLESYQKFNVISWLRVPILISNYIAPVVVLLYTSSLFYVVLVLVLGRIVTFFGHFYAVSKVVEGFYQDVRLSRQHLKPLVKFGGWLTISNTITPFMTYLDRFLIAVMLSSQVIAYYATPYDVITKMSIVPTAVMSVMFPALTSEFTRSTERTRALYLKSLKYIFLILIIPILILIFFSRPLISLWITPDFATHSYQLAQVLAIGFFLNSLNLVPYSVIQAIGRSDITAKIHMAEFPIYLATLFFFVHQFGILGAPLAFLVRIIIDSLILHRFAQGYLRERDA